MMRDEDLVAGAFLSMHWQPEAAAAAADGGLSEMEGRQRWCKCYFGDRLAAGALSY